MEDTPTPIAELDHGPSKLEVFLEENQKTLIAAATSIFLAVLGYVGFTSYATMQSAKAGESLAMANDSGSLNKVVTAFAGSQTSTAASLTLLNQSDQGASSAELKSLHDECQNPALKANIAVQLGLTLLADGELEQANQVLIEAADSEGAGFIAPIARLALGDIAKQQGDTETAKQYYNEVANLAIGGPTAQTEDAIISQATQKYYGYQQLANQRLRFVDASGPELKPAANSAVEENSEKNSQVGE